VQAASNALRLAGPGRYSELDATVAAGAGWTIRRDPLAAGGVCLVATAAEVPSDTITIRFQGTDLAVALGPGSADPGAPAARLFVTVDGSTARVAASLPRDDQGRPYIGGQAAVTGRRPAGLGEVRAADLARDDGGAVLVPVVEHLGSERPPGIHTVELTADGANVTFDGFEVRSERSLLPFAAATAALLIALGVVIVALRQGRGATAN
jgi:hypothetical protein